MQMNEHPNAAPVRIGMMADSSRPVSDYQDVLRSQEASGLLTIVAMDDDIAWVVCHDKKFAAFMQLPYAPKVRS